MEVAKILVVDDEPSILKMLKEALTQWGYHVGCVGTGTEAVRLGEVKAHGRTLMPAADWGRGARIETGAKFGES